MKVAILRSLGHEWETRLLEGDEVDVSQELADKLISAHLAVPVEQPRVKKPKAAKQDQPHQESD